MINLRWIDKGGLKEFISDLNDKIVYFKYESKKLGNDTADFMKKTINENKVRPQDGAPTKLENSIDVTHNADGSWGVGEIDKMNEEAPHWRAVNFGSNHMVGKAMPPYFNPDKTEPSSEKFREGRVDYNGKKGTGGGVTVTKPIPAMNYVEKTIEFVKSRIESLRYSFRRR